MNAQTFADLRGRNVYAVYDRTGYLYGLYAARVMAAVQSRLRDDDPNEPWRIQRTSLASVSDPDEVHILN